MFLSKSLFLIHVSIQLLFCKRCKRGYVVDKGWAHSSAHTADALCSLAESKFIKYEELMEMLDIIKDKICVDTYTYINEEE
ncbi:DUF2785 domain-containing protein [Clostridium collagenovorans]|uniref:DUF2785 domain-containing protein n=1 Tax=Clostridium collagenovorans TaxID=29357 RepID=UPI0009353D77